MKELYLIIKGKVQGVFFRATLKEIANELQIFGYAKNLNDGSVEVVAQGFVENLSEFLKKIKQSPGDSKVKYIKDDLRDIDEKCFDFKIL